MRHIHTSGHYPRRTVKALRCHQNRTASSVHRNPETWQKKIPVNSSSVIQNRSHHSQRGTDKHLSSQHSPPCCPPSSTSLPLQFPFHAQHPVPAGMGEPTNTRPTRLPSPSYEQWMTRLADPDGKPQHGYPGLRMPSALTSAHMLINKYLFSLFCTSQPLSRTALFGKWTGPFVPKQVNLNANFFQRPSYYSDKNDQKVKP